MGVKGNGIKSLKSFSRPENRKLGNCIIITCTILLLCILSLIKAHYCPAPHVKSQENEKLQVSEKTSLKMVAEESGDGDLFFQDDEDDEEGPKQASLKPKPLCYQSSMRSDTCESSGDIRIDPSSKTVFISNPLHQETKIKPYCRKGDNAALSHVKEWFLKPLSKPTPQCTKNHSSPAIIFSIGGFTGNLFHDYTDILIPLFITSLKFNKEVHFFISDTKPWWVGRYSSILKQLSNHEIIDTESNEDSGTTLCFPKVTIGLTFHNELGVDSTKNANHSMLEFKALVRGAFKLSRTNAISKRPRLLIIARKNSRKFVNLQGMIAMASSIGYDVRVGEADMNTDVAKFARLVNTADVLLGVHGAGLTNMIYLPVGAVVIQVVPLGGLRWLAKDSFEEPASDMGLKYMEYVIKEEESTLLDEYEKEDEVIRDPLSVHKKGWNMLREIYLDKQNVRVHLGRLRGTLLDAMKLLPQRRSFQVDTHIGYPKL